MTNHEFDGGVDKNCVSRRPPAADARLLALGKSLHVVRTIGFRESLHEFSIRLNICVNTLRKMESGHPGVAIGTWFQAFELMHVDSSVVDAAAPDALLFLTHVSRQ